MDSAKRAVVCPESRLALAVAEEGLVRRLQAAAALRRLRNVAGRQVAARLDGALVRQDNAVAYPIVDGIPLLLVDEAIPLVQLEMP